MVYLNINEDRINQLLTKISSFNSTPGHGTTRTTFSVAYLEASKYLEKKMNNLGLGVRVTSHGNMIAKWGGQEEKAGILVGSHIDTIPHGGNYDGVTGVVTAIEAIQSLKESGFKPNRPVYIIIFAEEEGSSFDHLLAGSQSLVGQLNSKDLGRLTNKEDLSYLECAQKFQKSFTPSTFDIITKDFAIAMIELHIEQSVVLEKKGIPIGIVDNISGAQQFSFNVKGQTNHAGATPMIYRYDALAGAAEAIIRVEKIVKAFRSKTAVATCGTISCLPGAPNVIPGEATFTLDIRDITVEYLEELKKEILKEVEKIMYARNLGLSIKPLSNTLPIPLDKSIISLLKEIASQNKIASLQMHSGAVHDTASIAQIIPSGMIFVPSRQGISHSPDEFTKTEDITIGCRILAEAIKHLSSN